MCSFFFFQAEDGIRDLTVTGVQTCALPIYRGDTAVPDGAAGAGQRRSGATATGSRRAVPEAGPGALRGRSRVPHRRATGAGGARRGRGVALARAYRRPGREAAAVPTDRREIGRAHV